MQRDLATTAIRTETAATGGGEPSRGQKIARAALAVALIALGLWTLHGFLGALAWAGIFAIATWPLYTRARRRFPPHRHDLLVPAAFTLGVALLFLGPLAIAGVQLGREVHTVIHLVDDVRRNGIPRPDFLARLPDAPALERWWDANLAPPASRQLIHTVNRGDLVSFARETLAQASRRAVLFFFTLLTLFFLFRDGEAVVGQMRIASHRAFGPRGEALGRQVIASVHGTVDGLVLVGLGEGLVLGIVYGLVGVTHATLLAAFTAIAAMVPFGAPVAFGVAAVVALAQGEAIGAGIIVAAGFAVSFFADHAIRPALIGGATRLPFLWVLLGILGGVETWGLLGLFLGPAIMAVLILLWREWTDVSGGAG